MMMSDLGHHLQTLINFVFRKLDTDIKRNNHNNIEKNLQVWWNQPKYIVLEIYEISYFQKKMPSAADGIHKQQNMCGQWLYLKEKS